MSEKKVLYKANKLNMIDFTFQWIQKNPKCFGERILIIQKRIGLAFQGQNHLVDFWALDQSGQLLIIECHINELKEADGWVMLNPRLMMPKLSKEQIREMFEKHLEGLKVKVSAKEILEAFFKVPYEELTLRDTRAFRLFLMSPNFSVDTLSKVTWLCSEGREIKCFSTKFVKGEKGALLTVNQYFPAKLTNKYDLGLVAFNNTLQKDVKMQNRRYLFWVGLLSKVHYKSSVFNNKFIEIHRPIVGGRFLNKQLHLSIFTYDTVSGVQLVFLPDDNKRDEKMYNDFHDVKEMLEKDFGAPLLWTLDKNNVYSISYRINKSIGNMAEWDSLQDQLLLKTMGFEKSVEKIYRHLYKKH